MKAFVISAFLIIFIHKVVGAMDAMTSNANNDVFPTEPELTSGWERIGRELGKCIKTDNVVNCAAIKMATAMQRVAKLQVINLTSGISLVRDSETNQRDSKALSDSELESILPKDVHEKTAKLFDILIETVSEFLRTHSLKVKLPNETSQELSRAFNEGRGKIKKVAGPLMLLMGLKLILTPIIMLIAGFMSVKALIIAKIALVIAAIVGLQSFSSGPGLFLGGKGGWNQGWNTNLGGGTYYPSNAWTNTGGWSSSYPYARSFNDAHDKAFAAQKPQ